MFSMKTLGKAALASGLRPVNNEGGSIIVIALVLLALATVMGISGTTTTSVELQISGNDRIQKQNFFLADAAIMEVAQRVTNNGVQMANPNSAGLNWFHDVTGTTVLPDQTDVTDDANWTNTYSQTSMIDSDTRFLTIFGGVSSGTSLDLSRARLYQFQLDSRTIKYKGRIYLQAGYRAAF